MCLVLLPAEHKERERGAFLTGRKGRRAGTGCWGNAACPGRGWRWIDGRGWAQVALVRPVWGWRLCLLGQVCWPRDVVVGSSVLKYCLLFPDQYCLSAFLTPCILMMHGVGFLEGCEWPSGAKKPHPLGVMTGHSIKNHRQGCTDMGRWADRR